MLSSDLDGPGPHEAIRRRAVAGTVRLVDAVALALGGFDVTEQLERADAELLTLRVHLGVADRLGLLAEEDVPAYVHQVDRIGRQLGGWLKRRRGVS